MLKIGLTGGIGSGKSTIAKIFSLIGAPIYSADREAKKLLHSDELKPKLISLFGTDVLNAEGELDRSEIAKKVFVDKEKLKALNLLIHPLVKKHFDAWVAVQRGKYIIKEAAILFESGAHEDIDKVIVVTSPEQLKIKRVMQRDGVSEEQVISRMKNQWNENELVKRADFIIQNDEKKLIIPQVIAIHEKIINLEK
jgi:dephospho-CoA kinase